MRRIIVTLAILAVVGTSAGTAWVAMRQRPPALVESLRALPEVARVDYSGSASAPAVVVHLRDWHFVPRDQCQLVGIEFDANLAAVEKVQADELAIARFLIRDHGLKDVICEGLSPESMPALRLRLDVLKDLKALAGLGGMDEAARQHQRELSLEIGIPGMLLQRGEIERVLPLEDARANEEAGPIIEPDGGIRFDPAKLNARRRAMVAKLPTAGIALVVLGGTHDLGPYLPSEVLYIRVTTRSYPGHD